MNIKHTIFFVPVLALAFLGGCNYFSNPYERIVKNWCNSKNGQFQKEHKGFPYSPDHCKIPVTKGKANIIVGHEIVKFSSKVIDFDTGKREVYANILNSEKSGWASEKLRGTARGWRNVYDEVVIGSYILTNAP